MEAENKNHAFMQLYTPVHARLCRYVQTLVWQQEDAKDLISEITLVAYEKFDAIRHREKFAEFLFGVARNLFLKRLRKQQFKGRLSEEALQAVEGDRTADERVRRMELANLLNQLPPLQREAITLFEVAGFSYEEIAGLLEIRLSKVKSTIYTGRQTLKAIISREQQNLVYRKEARVEPKLKMDNLL